MPDDSNGIYNVPSGTLVNTGDTVLPSQHNPWALDSSQAISNRFSKDGRSPATGDWDINNFRLKQVGNPTASGDAANKNYVDTQITAVNQNAEKISTQAGNYTALLADKATSFRFTASATLSLTAAATLGSNWWCEVWATNGNVTIDPNGAETINGAATLIVQTGQSAKVFCTGTQFFAWVVSDALSGPQVQGFSSGLVQNTNTADPANDVDISSGYAASDISPYTIMQLASTLTKRIDAAWAIGNNQGGLDFGAVSASATYYIWLIQRSDTGVVDALFSLSSTAPTMPISFDRKRLIGRIVRASAVNGPPFYMLPRPTLQSGLQVIPSGVSLLYTGIPAGVAKFTVNFRNLIFSAVSQPFIKIGPSSGVVSSGYVGVVSGIQGSTSGAFDLSTFAALINDAGATLYNGSVTFIRLPATNDWIFTGQIATGNLNRGMSLQGAITLSGEVDRFQISSAAGTATMSGTAIWADWEFSI